MAGTWAITKAKKRSPNWRHAPGANIFSSDVDLTADGNVTMKIALPDSGSNAATALAAMVAEMLGFTTRDQIRLVWGDSDLAPLSDEWFGGRTITLQGAAICSATDKLRKDLLARAADVLKIDAAKLKMRDGVISSTEDPKKSTTFAALAKVNNGLIRQTGRGTTGGERTAANKGVGACFVEVEVDTWTGNWRFVRAVYTHDTGLVINPLGIRIRHGGIVGGKHSGGHRSHSVGPRISRHAALQRRLPVLPASHHHGHSQVHAGVHRQSGAALVLRREELQRNHHWRGAGRDLQRDFQRLRRPHSGAPHHAGKNHGRTR